MIARAGFTVGSVAALSVLFAGVPLYAGEQGNLDQQRPQQQTQLASEAAAEIRPPSGATSDGSASVGAQGSQSDTGREAAAVPVRRDSKLEQTRLRLEEELKARRQMTGGFEADPDSRRRDMRFGVGYEFRMRGQQELGFGSPAGFAGGGAVPGAGGARGFGNGRR